MNEKQQKTFDELEAKWNCLEVVDVVAIVRCRDPWYDDQYIKIYPNGQWSRNSFFSHEGKKMKKYLGNNPWTE